MKLFSSEGRRTRLVAGPVGGRSEAAEVGTTTKAALVAISVALMLCAQAALAQMTSFRTTSGHELSLPPVSSLNCAELDKVLRKIDAVNYRSIGSSRPSDPGDSALYDYEDAVSARLARVCGGVTKSQSFGRSRSGSNWDFGK